VKKKIFDWKKKTAMYLGRFQPFHEGHKNLFLKVLKKNNQIAILVMDSYKINNKNPFKFSNVKRRIYRELKNYRSKFIIIKVPVISRFVYGRKVGYKIEKIYLGKKLERISATNLRKKIKKNNENYF
jgi:cytidyltransferase-like protein